MTEHLVVGQEGESTALRYVRSLGYRIYNRNVHLGRDEIDLIAFDPVDSVLVFIEVKTRSDPRSGFAPENNFTWSKKKKVLRSARRWVARYAYEGFYRVDVICVAGKRVTEHYKEIGY